MHIWLCLCLLFLMCFLIIMCCMRAWFSCKYKLSKYGKMSPSLTGPIQLQCIQEIGIWYGAALVSQIEHTPFPPWVQTQPGSTSAWKRGRKGPLILNRGRPGVAVWAHAFPVMGSNAAGVDVSVEMRSQRNPYSSVLKEKTQRGWWRECEVLVRSEGIEIMSLHQTR